jgi:hypothetical protein
MVAKVELVITATLDLLIYGLVAMEAKAELLLTHHMAAPMVVKVVMAVLDLQIIEQGVVAQVAIQVPVVLEVQGAEVITLAVLDLAEEEVVVRVLLTLLTQVVVVAQDLTEKVLAVLAEELLHLILEILQAE